MESVKMRMNEALNAIRPSTILPDIMDSTSYHRTTVPVVEATNNYQAHIIAPQQVHRRQALKTRYDIVFWYIFIFPMFYDISISVYTF